MKYTVMTPAATKQYNTAVLFLNNSHGARRLNFSPFHKEVKQWAKHQGYSAKLYLRSAAIECNNPDLPKESLLLVVDLIQIIANGQAYLIAVNISGPPYDNNLHYILEEHARLRKAIFVQAESLDDVICEVPSKDHHYKDLQCIPDIKARNPIFGDYSILFSPENLTWKTASNERA